MGNSYQCNCTKCNTVFNVHDGDGMHSLGLICNQCGNRSYVPRSAPRPPRDGRVVPSFLQTDEFQSLPPVEFSKIRRFTEDELKNIQELSKRSNKYERDQWDEFELSALIELKNPCNCGGTINLASLTFKADNINSLTRCPNCNSSKVTSTLKGSWD